MKKAFEIFFEKNKNLSENKFTQIVKKTLRSYELQKSQGITQISAFENSLLNPTVSKSKKIKIIEMEIKNANIKQRSHKLNKLFLYQAELDNWINQGLSMRKMRILLWQLHKFKISHETVRQYVKMLYDVEKINKK